MFIHTYNIMHYSVIREFYHNGNHCGYIQVYPQDAKHLYVIILDMHTMHKQVYMSVEHHNEYDANDIILCVLNTLTTHLAHDDHGRMYMFEEYVLSSSGNTSELTPETAIQVMKTLDSELLVDDNVVTTYGRIVCEKGTLRMMYDGEPWTPGCGDDYDAVAKT